MKKTLLLLLSTFILSFTTAFALETTERTENNTTMSSTQFGNYQELISESIRVGFEEPQGVALFDSNGTELNSTNNALNISLHDGDGNPLSSYYNQTTGDYVLDIHDADVHNSPVNQYFHQHTNNDTNLTTATANDGSDYIINVIDTTGFTVGDYVQIGFNNHQGLKYQITDLNATSLTLDSYIDREFAIGTAVREILKNIATLGSMASPQEYIIKPNPGQVIHITRLIITMTHGTNGDLGLFGNLPALSNGFQIRAFIDGQYGSFTTWKTNAEIKDDMYDLEFDVRSSGGGTYGTSGRGSFWKIGVVVRLDGDRGDYIEAYNKDDLTGLITFKLKAQGHAEGG